MSDKRKKYDAPENTKATVVRLFRLLRPQRVRLSAVGVSIVLYIILAIYTPFKSAQVVDAIWHGVQIARENGIPFSTALGGVGSSIISLSIFYLFMCIFYYLQAFLMASVADNLTMSLRKMVAAKLNVLPLKFFDQNKSGEILSRVTNDLDKITETLQTGLLKLLVAVGTVIGSLAVMFYYNVLLTVIFLAFMAVCIIITRIVVKKL